MPIPMLADFAVRLACGLAVLLLLTPWQDVPPRFFRTHCLVILGLLVLAALDLSRAGTSGAGLPVLIGAAVLGYFAAVAWGLGLPRLGISATAALAAATGGVLVAAARTPAAEAWTLGAAGRLASAFLLGATLTAMLLGHYYLTAPAMSITPLRRFVRCMAWGLAVRTVLAAFALLFWAKGEVAVTSSPYSAPLFLAMRWGMGLAGPVIATTLAWKTVQIRSTQSATGILYIAMILVLFGELTSLIISRDAGVVF